MLVKFSLLNYNFGFDDESYLFRILFLNYSHAPYSIKIKLNEFYMF